jgi:heme exporter protein A
MSPGAPSSPLLSVQALAFSRNEEPVFGPLHFHLDAGEALLVRGGNGAGKTTLLRVLAGLLYADEGRILLDGVPAASAARARAMAYLGHLPALKGDLGALENLDFLCGLHGRRPHQQPAEAMALTGLAGYEDTPARQLSAGQKKRLSLARLWLAPAPLWLLDEPYANLDLDGITLVNRMVAAHLRDGGAALVTTHGAYAAPPVRTRLLDLDEPSRLADARSAAAATASAEPGMAGPEHQGSGN